MFDWDRFEAELFDALVTAVGDGRWRAVALSDLYAEAAGAIAAPCLGLNESYVDDWAPESWMEALTAEACAGTIEHWDTVFARYEDVLVRICRRAGARLGIPVYLIDDERYEETLRQCLTRTQLDELFPELAAAAAERKRLATLPAHERIAHYISRLDRLEGPTNSETAEKALRDLGSAAVPALLPLLRRPDLAWRAAKLLAEISIAEPPVLAALGAAIDASKRDSPDQLWPCRALARLGRLDLVLAKASALSTDAIATAVTAPYTSFRDGDAYPLHLNYQPLEDFLFRYPERAPDIADNLAPGRGYCAITPAEVDEALRGTTSPHPLIRKHAVIVLGEPTLGPDVRERVIPALHTATKSDPDPEVRRLAGLSLLWWQR